MATRLLVVSIDTEVDKSRDWTISNPATFRSVTSAIPSRLVPLMADFGIRATYLLSPEVIEDDASAQVLASFGEGVELGTHLHPQFVAPERSLWASTMAGCRADAIAAQYGPITEREKLATMTALFEEKFGRSPTAFRAGRFGLTPTTLESLASLGYVVDSSVTPGIRWTYREGTVDYRRADRSPHMVETESGSIVEIPVTTLRLGWAESLRSGTAVLSECYGRLRRNSSGVRWLRPSWMTGPELWDLAERTQDRFLVMMFHSVELEPGASPYSSSQADVDRILESLRYFFAKCMNGSDYRSVTLTEAAAIYRAE